MTEDDYKLTDAIIFLMLLAFMVLAASGVLDK